MQFLRKSGWSALTALIGASVLPTLFAVTTIAEAASVEDSSYVVSPSLGWVYRGKAPWYYVYRNQSWIYTSVSIEESEALWGYEPGLGWIWVGAQFDRWLYSREGDGWFYRVETASPQALFSASTNRWFDLDGDFSWLMPRAAEAMDFATGRYRQAMASIPARRFPYQVDQSTGDWVTNTSSNWGSGFFPASLLQIYRWTGDESIMDDVESRLVQLESQKNNTSIHDVGFMIGTPFILAYNVTGDTHYRDVAVTGAGSLSTRFNESIGSIDSWDWGDWSNYHDTIIDNMMNLEILLWGGKQSGGNPSWITDCESHADLTAEQLIRSDGSVIHIVAYNRSTNQVAFKQGFAGRSGEIEIFARGQAWAIYGYIVMYRETSEERYFETAMELLDFWWDHRLTSGIPPFEMSGVTHDFDGFPDASGAAIVASALMDLSTFAPDGRGSEFRQRGEELLSILVGSDFLGDGAGTGILYHQTNGNEATKIDTAICYGDYYLLEALMRYLTIYGDQ